jgi:hypothetical protein
VGLEETVGMDRGQLENHPAASWIVECVRELFVSLVKKPVHIQIALMVTLRRIAAKWFDLLEDALAEPLESHLSELAKDLPV